jgi:hypothetical protein
MKSSSDREKEREYKEHEKIMKLECVEKEKMMIMRINVLSGVWCGVVNLSKTILNNFLE